jgi:hypothetical protein
MAEMGIDLRTSHVTSILKPFTTLSKNFRIHNIRDTAPLCPHARGEPFSTHTITIPDQPNLRSHNQLYASLVPKPFVKHGFPS